MAMNVDALDDLRKMCANICPACDQPLPVGQRSRAVTCSDDCHRVWIDRLVARYGETREIASAETGVVYVVPTRVILEQGITGADLSRYPPKGVPSITCPVCHRTSYNPNDIANRYCGFCHQFHEDMREASR